MGLGHPCTLGRLMLKIWSQLFNPSLPPSRENMFYINLGSKVHIQDWPATRLPMAQSKLGGRAKTLEENFVLKPDEPVALLKKVS